MVGVLNASLPNVENSVHNIVHLALHKVNSNRSIMEFCSPKLKSLQATLRQQLTFDFLKVPLKIDGKSGSRGHKKAPVSWRFFYS